MATGDPICNQCGNYIQFCSCKNYSIDYNGNYGEETVGNDVDFSYFVKVDFRNFPCCPGAFMVYKKIEKQIDIEGEL